MITRFKAIQNLQSKIGLQLEDYATQYGITIKKDGGGINKGWKGQVAEHHAGLSNNNNPAPNGLGFEQKIVALHNETVKESMAVCMLNPELLAKEENFFISHVWEKLKRLLIVYVSYDGRNALTSKLIGVKSLDLVEEEGLIQEIKADYDLIRNRFMEEGFDALTSTDGKWLQTRTKGSSNSKSRAFYARAGLVKKLNQM